MSRTSDPSAPGGVTLSGAELHKLIAELREASRLLAAMSERLASFEGEGEDVVEWTKSTAGRRSRASVFSAHVRWHVQRHKLKAGCCFCDQLKP